MLETRLMTTTDATEVALLDALTYELEDLNPKRSGMTLDVAGLHLWYEDDGRQRAIFVRGGPLRRRRSERRYTNLDPIRVARQLRHLLTARARAERQADLLQDAQRKRMWTAALQPIEAAVTALN